MDPQIIHAAEPAIRAAVTVAFFTGFFCHIALSCGADLGRDLYQRVKSAVPRSFIFRYGVPTQRKKWRRVRL